MFENRCVMSSYVRDAIFRRSCCFFGLYIPEKLISTVNLACVASVSARVRRKNGDESKKKGLKGEGEGNFRAITRLETLPTQATEKPEKATLGL